MIKSAFVGKLQVSCRSGKMREKKKVENGCLFIQGYSTKFPQHIPVISGTIFCSNTSSQSSTFNLPSSFTWRSLYTLLNHIHPQIILFIMKNITSMTTPYPENMNSKSCQPQTITKFHSTTISYSINLQSSTIGQKNRLKYIFNLSHLYLVSTF